MDTLWLGAKNEHHFIPLVSKVYVRFIRNITIFDKLKRVDKFILLKSTFIIWDWWIEKGNETKQQ